jgi:hypothetical protein
VFLQSPHASRRHDLYIYDDIRKGLPPAKELPVIGTPSPDVEQLWQMITACWNTDPTARPSGTKLQQYMRDYGDDLRETFKEGIALAPTCLIGE